MKFSIFVWSPVNGVSQFMLYSFLGVEFMVVSSVEVVNGFVVVEAIYFRGSSFWNCHSIFFWSGLVTLAKCILWIACSFVTPLNILRYNQVYSLFVQSSSQTPEFS